MSDDSENETSTNAMIVLVIDGLNASMLGPYGNTSIETPAFNRLAAQSILFDFAVAQSPQLEPFCKSWWEQISVGNQSLCVSDDSSVCELAESQFDRVVPVAVSPTTELANGPSTTQSARFFVEAIEALNSIEAGDLCWLHCMGLAGNWDAPYEMRQFFAVEEDPDPPTSPNRPVADFDLADVDPDELLGYQQSAYAQVVLLDDFLGLMLDHIESNPLLKNAALVVTSPRGYPLGEHGVVGRWNNLFSESLHVPIFYRPASAGNFAGYRNQWIVQTDQVIDLLQRQHNDDSNSSETFPLPWPIASATSTDFQKSQRAYSSIDHAQSLQTSDWKIIVNRPPDAVEEIKLFSKPDDRWEVNDVSSRCPQVVEELLEELQQLNSPS